MKEINSSTKICLICKEEKNRSEFKVNKRNGDKILLRPNCKICDRAKQRGYSRAHKSTPAYKEYQRNYNKKQREKKKASTPPKVKIEALTKVCRNCKIEKENSAFGVISRKKDGVKIFFFNYICKKCACEVAMVRYHKLKNNPEFREQNRKRCKEWLIVNREYNLAKQKEKREKPENIIRRKEYDIEHADRIKELSKARNQRYHRKLFFEVNDVYGIKLLRAFCYRHKESGLTIEHVKNSPEMILKKRREVVLRRLQKIIKKL